MMTARMTSVAEDYPGNAEETFNAVLMSAIAGCRSMAVMAQRDEDADTVTQAVASRMESAGAGVMVATAQQNASLADVIGQIVAATPGDGDGPAGLAVRLLRKDDAGLLIVKRAHALAPEALDGLLELSQTQLEDGRVLQVLLSGATALETLLDRPEGRPIAVSRWHLTARSEPNFPMAASRVDGETWQPRPVQPSPGHEPEPVKASRLTRGFGILGVLAVMAAAAGWVTSDRPQPEATVAAAEMPEMAEMTDVAPPEAAPPEITPTVEVVESAAAPLPIEQAPAPLPELAVTTDHGSKPTLSAGETIVVRVETTTDKFVYCYYMDGFGNVARLFPNRFQSDAFVPAGQAVEIPPGPERPFNIRLDTPGQVEAVSCLASTTEIERGRISGADAEDLLPIPGLGLEDLLNDFATLSDTGLRSVTMPITVVAEQQAVAGPYSLSSDSSETGPITPYRSVEPR
ncbi:hypothetical protein N825_31460 [Skermanella stibiiresistens SB22]|uniref:DUF4384 domain-containing protein n=1 Tax=Skermanella stibiiresistens SB22 TaxID=1385369 RepID=W9H5E0_9PROT|nr:DUF4384 domain-containing protein [Skermanella stibiiresistens]EWY41249.1 hypothetical protein N825_31460 [Skermanella stibiiresistens SB22]